MICYTFIKYMLISNGFQHPYLCPLHVLVLQEQLLMQQ